MVATTTYFFLGAKTGRDKKTDCYSKKERGKIEHLYPRMRGHVHSSTHVFDGEIHETADVSTMMEATTPFSIINNRSHQNSR